MKFSLFVKLLEFTPEITRLISDNMVLGDYNGKESFWFDNEVQNMEIEVIEINHMTKKIILEIK